MPELPDIHAYLDALHPRVVGCLLQSVLLKSPFLLRTVEPPLEAATGQPVVGLRRIGKRIVLCLTDELFLVIHLMIAGRLRWSPAGKKPSAPNTLAVFALRPTSTLPASAALVRESSLASSGRSGNSPTNQGSNGHLLLTEAGSKKRASLHVIQGEDNLKRLDPGGLEVLQIDASTFRDAIRRENHTLKRALTDPRLFSGIGNAYSDEILHAAGLSPIALTSRLTEEEANRLYTATRSTLELWITRLRTKLAGRFPGPGDVTAFRPEFAVHGRFGQPCPVCTCPVQRIRYADNETNYCPKCQTGGKILADRSLSRLLREDWPKTVQEL